MNDFYVYIYYDPRKDPLEPIYVGKGHGDRYMHHVKRAKNKHLKNKINKIQEAGFKPLIEFAAFNLSENDALKLEMELIVKYGRSDKGLGPLCNWTDGGEGTSGYKHSEKTRKIFSEQRKGKKQTEKQYLANCSRRQSEIARAKIGKATKGHRWHTDEQIEKIKENNRTRTITDEMRAKWSETRLGNTPTKIQYPPLDELLNMINDSSRNQVAKAIGVNYTSLTKYLKRRGVTLKDARFKVS